MKKFLKIAVVMSALFLLSGLAFAEEVTREEIVGLTEQTVKEMAADAPLTIQDINDGVDPYRDEDMPDLYVFVYDHKVNLVAHPEKGLVGRNDKERKDRNGKLFCNEIVRTALKNGSGFVDYADKKRGPEDKTVYSRRIVGSDGNVYVVGAGMDK